MSSLLNASDAPQPTDEVLPLAVDPADAAVRPDEFRMKIQGGVLDNLGIKMYTRVGKVLVEFAANPQTRIPLTNSADSQSARTDTEAF